MIGEHPHKRFIAALVLLGGIIPPLVHYTWPQPAITPAGSQGMSMPQQVFAAVSAFGIKPLYMVLAVLVILMLRRRQGTDAAALRWSVTCFLIGEAFCAANYLGFGESSYLLEFLHSYGMVLAFALGAWAVMAFLDTRVVRFSDPESGCHMAALCRGCAKRDPQHSCAFATIMRIAIPGLMVIAAIPLTAPLRPYAYFTTILGGSYCYMHDLPHQVYEMRILPITAIVLLAAAWPTLRTGHPFALTRLLLVAAVGAMGFSWFRWVLFAAFFDNQLWFIAWEELTELVFIAAVLCSLFAFPAKPAAGSESTHA